MKTTIKIFLILTLPLMFLIGGCGHNVDTSAPIELNNGEKWVVPDAMIKHIQDMEARVENELTHELDNLAVFKAELIGDIDGLISTCSMEGKGHEELHKWLIPFMTHVKAFDPNEAPESAEQWLDEIESSLVDFHNYFQ